jgi:NDP-sugar pyrophosphorylase family protein
LDELHTVPPLHIKHLVVEAPRIGVIAAAGKGRRIHPRSSSVPKVMLEIAGKPLLVRNVELLRDALGIREIFIVIGYLGEQIREHFGDGSAFGVRIHYIENPTWTRDSDGAARRRAARRSRSCSSSATSSTSRRTIRSSRASRAATTAVCSVHETDDTDLIRKNYAVELTDGRISGLVEKPRSCRTATLAAGPTCSRPTSSAMRETPRSARTGRLELTDIIDHAARRGAPVLPFVLTGHYLNVNSIEDLNVANFLARALHFETQRVSIVIPAYNEAASIRHVVRDFLPLVYEVVVMDNESADGTGELARSAGAVVHSRKLRGYGDAIRQGMDAASGDILVIVEADGTFRAKDPEAARVPEGRGHGHRHADDAADDRAGCEHGRHPPLGERRRRKLIEALWWRMEPSRTSAARTARSGATPIGRSGRTSRATTPRSRPR